MYYFEEERNDVLHIYVHQKLADEVEACIKAGNLLYKNIEDQHKQGQTEFSVKEVLETEPGKKLAEKIEAEEQEDNVDRRIQKEAEKKVFSKVFGGKKPLMELSEQIKQNAVYNKTGIQEFITDLQCTAIEKVLKEYQEKIPSNTNTHLNISDNVEDAVRVKRLEGKPIDDWGFEYHVFEEE